MMDITDWKFCCLRVHILGIKKYSLINLLQYIYYYTCTCQPVIFSFIEGGFQVEQELRQKVTDLEQKNGTTFLMLVNVYEF